METATDTTGEARKYQGSGYHIVNPTINKVTSFKRIRNMHIEELDKNPDYSNVLLNGNPLFSNKVR